MGRFNTEHAAALIRAARADAGLTQAVLAARAGLRQPSLAQMESGTRPVSDEMLERVLAAADYRPSVPLAEHAAEIKEFAAAHGLDDVRVFGSVVRGEDGYGSDVDLLVIPRDGTDLLDLALFVDEAEAVLGFPVDAVSDVELPEVLADVVAEAVPL